MIWRNLSEFTQDTVCLVLASEYYMDSDYIRDKSEFLKLKFNGSMHQ